LKIIQSFWTKPYKHINVLGGYSNGWHHSKLESNTSEAIQKSVKFYELSAKCLRKLGYTIELFTDQEGASLISQNIYDNVNTSLDAIKDEPAELWTIGKIYSLEKAIEMSNEPCIHVDHDIFFRKPEIIKERIECDWDILVQSKEIDDSYKEAYEESIDIFCNIFGIHPFTLRFLKTYNFCYNCGFLGFKNKEISDKYIPAYYKLYKHISKQKLNMNKFIGLRAYCGNKGFGLKSNMNCIIEQILLTKIANFYNFYTREIFPVSSWCGGAGRSRIISSKKLGFKHASGQRKYDKENFEKIISEFNT